MSQVRISWSVGTESCGRRRLSLVTDFAVRNGLPFSTLNFFSLQKDSFPFPSANIKDEFVSVCREGVNTFDRIIEEEMER